MANFVVFFRCVVIYLSIDKNVFLRLKPKHFENPKERLKPKHFKNLNNYNYRLKKLIKL